VMVCSSTALSSRLKVAATDNEWSYSVRWESITPFGVPVLPLV